MSGMSIDRYARFCEHRVTRRILDDVRPVRYVARWFAHRLAARALRRGIRPATGGAQWDALMREIVDDWQRRRLD